MAVIGNSQLLPLIARVCEVPGDFIEIGVFRGATFKRLSLLAHALGKMAHAFDSFEGMAPPTDMDFGQYPAGKLSVGGVEAFEQILVSAEIPNDSFKLWPGFVPKCFKGFKEPIAFALLDVDQYEPTKVSLDWVWPRLAPGGILVLDDYFRKREGLASLAIDEWLPTLDPVEARVLDYVDTQLYVQKVHVPSNPFPEHMRKKS